MCAGGACDEDWAVCDVWVWEEPEPAALEAMARADWEIWADDREDVPVDEEEAL